MAKIQLSKSHDLGLDEALTRAQRLLGELKERFGATVEWSGSKAKVKGTGFSGEASVSASGLDLHIDLGLLASGFKGKIESRLTEKLESEFGPRNA